MHTYTTGTELFLSSMVHIVTPVLINVQTLVTVHSLASSRTMKNKKICERTQLYITNDYM